MIIAARRPLRPIRLGFLQRRFGLGRRRDRQVRGAVAQHERHAIAFADRERGHRLEILAAMRGRRAQHQQVRAGNRDQIAVGAAAHPRHHPAVIETDHQLRAEFDAAAFAHDDARKLRPFADARHEVDHRGGAGWGLESRLQDHRVGPVAPRDTHIRLIDRDDLPAPVLGLAQQGGEAGVRIESRRAQPVDGTVFRDQCGGAAIADQRIVFDSQGSLLVLI